MYIYNVKKAFIETGKNYPQHNRASSSIGLRSIGYDVELVDTETILRKSENKEPGLYHGRMSTQHKIWDNLGIIDPKITYYPDHLQPLLNRNVRVSTIGETKKLIEKTTLFVKPHWTNRKQFCGCVISNWESYVLNEPDDTMVVMDEPTQFSSEWRLFVHTGLVISVGHYAGKLHIVPPTEDIEKLTIQSKDIPRTYCADFGFNVHANEWQLIEVNDVMYAGTYGIHPKTYASMLEARWAELTRNLL